MEFSALELKGDGSGSGDGDGSYGSGSVDGSGSGSGYGSGYGSGDGSEKTNYMESVLAPFGAKFPNHRVCFWRCNNDNRPANGGDFGTLASEGLTETITGPLKICTSQGLHGTLNPKKWKGEKLWIVALQHPVQSDDDKFASLTRVFVKDLGLCPW